MLNKLISRLLVCVVCLTAISPIQLKAQTQENQVAKNEALKSSKKIEFLDLNQFSAKPLTADFPVQLDTKKLEKENLDPARKSGLSKGRKTALYIGIGAAIAATVIIVVVDGNRNSGQSCVTWCQSPGCPPLC